MKKQVSELKIFKLETIVKQLRKIGIKKGDIVFVKVDLLELGAIATKGKKFNQKGFLEALKSAIGPEGTIVTASYTKTHFFPWYKKQSKLFCPETTPPNTGAFANQVWKHDGSFRSCHPTNSHVVFGKNAKWIANLQSPKESPYSLIGQVAKLGGKFLIVGCVDSNPGFATAHFVQEELGFAKMNRFSGLMGATFKDKDKTKVYLRKEFGGHNAGAWRFYDHFKKEGLISEGKIGNTKAVLATGKDIMPIERKLFCEDKKFILCEDPECFTCRCCWNYSGLEFINYFRLKLANLVTRNFLKLNKN